MIRPMRALAVTFALLLVVAACRRSETPAADPSGTSTAASPATTTEAAAAPAAAGPVDVGSQIPASWTATNLDGSKFELASMKDKVVLVNLWATWCGPCRYEIPELQAIHDRFKPQGFEVLGVSLDEGGADVVKPFVEEQKMTYPVVLDPRGKLADLLETSLLPTTVLVDRSGKIVWKKLGAIAPKDEALEKAIEAALGGKVVES